MCALPGDLNAAVLGAGGFAGGELLRLLSLHPEVGAVRGFSASQAGRPWDSVHPPLMHLGENTFETFDVSIAAGWADVLFLALPHGKSQEVMDEIEGFDPGIVVDLAADFRISDAELYGDYYGAHKCWDSVESFRYGLVDADRQNLKGATRIAAPGCFATATLLGLFPLAEAGLLRETPVCVGLTGSSGAGVGLKPTTHHPRRAHNLFAYGTTGHRHEAEIADRLRCWDPHGARTCTLLPHSAPLVRGIYATLTVRAEHPCPEPKGMFEKTYADRPFVKILDRPPELASVVATNFAHLHAAARNGGRELVVYVAIDNLVKGAAGQAVQAMNIALNIDETSGLMFSGVSPC